LFNMQRLAEYRQGNARAEYSDAVLDQKLQDLAVRLSGAYMDVLLARDSIDLAEAKLKAISEQLAAAKRMYELGDGTVTDVDEATARR
ncbi:TolC family protein, partial [Staphylococcus aureus]|nr:TolC family protein [Staphylococcus aureus]